MSKSMNKYHKCMSELGRSKSGWVKVGALAMGVGVGMGGVHVPGGGVSKARAGGAIPRADETKKDAKHIRTTTVNVALQNRCLNFENANIFLSKTLFFVLPTVALLYFVRKKSKSDNNG